MLTCCPKGAVHWVALCYNKGPPSKCTALFFFIFNKTNKQNAGSLFVPLQHLSAVAMTSPKPLRLILIHLLLLGCWECGPQGNMTETCRDLTVAEGFGLLTWCHNWSFYLCHLQMPSVSLSHFSRVEMTSGSSCVSVTVLYHICKCIYFFSLKFRCFHDHYLLQYLDFA